MLRRISFFTVMLWAVSPAGAQDLPDGPGKGEVLDKCGKCHGVDVVAGMAQSRAQWEETINAMVARGMDLDDKSLAAILDYLATYLGPKPKINVNKAAAAEMETGLEISAKEAEAIVKYREQHGAFKDWRELTKIEGVDARKIEARKDLITVD